MAFPITCLVGIVSTVFDVEKHFQQVQLHCISFTGQVCFSAKFVIVSPTHPALLQVKIIYYLYEVMHMEGHFFLRSV